MLLKPRAWTAPITRRTLVKQLDQRHDKLIVTTIQKLNRAISTDRYLESIDYLKIKKWCLSLMNVIAVNLVRPIRTSKSSSAMHKCLDLPVTPIFEEE